MHQQRRKSDQRVTGELCRRFGAVAVRKGFSSLEQIKEAISEQIEDDAAGREHRLLGSILFEKGWITEHQIELVLLELRKAS